VEVSKAKKVRKTTYRGRNNFRMVRRVVTKPNGDREITVTPAWIDEFGSSIVLVVKLVGVSLLAIGLAFGAEGRQKSIWIAKPRLA